MLRKLAVLAATAVLCVTSLVGCGSAASSSSADKASDKDLLGRIQERGTMIVATEGDWAPWTYHDESGELTGYDVELAKEVAKKLGVEAEFQETVWDSILAGVDSGRFDVAFNGVDYTEERAKKYNFSDPYLYNFSVLVVKDDNDTIKTLEDLKGKKTANTASSTYAGLAEEYGATVDPVDSLEQTIELVTTGRVDATINAQGSIEDYLSEHPDASIKIVSTFPGQPVVVPIRQGEDCESLKNAIDAAIADLKKEGKLKELSEKYFGTDLTERQ